MAQAAEEEEAKASAVLITATAALEAVTEANNETEGAEEPSPAPATESAPGTAVAAAPAAAAAAPAAAPAASAAEVTPAQEDSPEQQAVSAAAKVPTLVNFAVLISPHDVPVLMTAWQLACASQPDAFPLATFAYLPAASCTHTDVASHKQAY